MERFKESLIILNGIPKRYVRIRLKDSKVSSGQRERRKIASEEMIKRLLLSGSFKVMLKKF